ncbi:MAG TPA: hypothetical protein VGE12_20290 [Noviherbaspirillum sp.]
MELGIEACTSPVGINAVAPLSASGALAGAARAVAGAVLVAVVPFTDVFAAGLAADCTLFFTAVLVDFAMAFVAADLVFDAGPAAVAVFASLPVPAVPVEVLADLAAVLPFVADLPTPLAAALFVAVLVTVAFIVPSLVETPETRPYYPRILHPLFSGRPGWHQARRETRVHAYCQTTTSVA